MEPRPNVTDDVQHRNFLHVERIAVVTAKVAHAVEEDIVAGGEAANGEVVALRATFACGQTDAGNIAQRIAQRGRALVLNNVLGNDVDGLRSLHQRVSQ